MVKFRKSAGPFVLHIYGGVVFPLLEDAYGLKDFLQGCHSIEACFVIIHAEQAFRF